jgi:hypothetical protein
MNNEVLWTEEQLRKELIERTKKLRKLFKQIPILRDVSIRINRRYEKYGKVVYIDLLHDYDRESDYIVRGFLMAVTGRSLGVAVYPSVTRPDFGYEYLDTVIAKTEDFVENVLPLFQGKVLMINTRRKR